RTFAEQVSAESVSRLLPSLKPLVWHNLSEADLQSGAPFAEIGHIMRPVTIDDVVMRDSVSLAPLAASLARLLRSSMVSPGLFSVGSLPNILPISLIRPGFSSRAGASAGGAASAGAGAAGWTGACASCGAGGGAF